MPHQDVWQVFRSDVDDGVLMVEGRPHEQLSIEPGDGRVDAEGRSGGLVLPDLEIVVDP